MNRKKFKTTSLLFGLLVIAAGALLFAFNAGFLQPEYKTIVFSWQTLLIALGLVLTFSRNSYIFGIILMLAGGIFILPKLNIEALSFLHGNGWAVFLVVAGIIIICRALYGNRFNKKCFGNKHGNYCDNSKTRQTTDGNSTGFIEQNCVFGASKERITVKHFKGGEINCVFGSLELDLSDAELSEGVNTLEINTVFGGTEIYVPPHWTVEIKQTNIFGGFEDNRPKSNFEIDEKKALILRVSSVFGGGEIKCK